MKKLILIDANAIIHRAFYALPPLKSPRGLITNAVFGFSSIILKMIKDLKPDYIAAAYDLPKPTFRHEAYKEYKSQRAKTPDELAAQVPYTKRVLNCLGIPIYEMEGYEADDLIGSMAEKLKKEKNLKIIIVTGDLDSLQLIEDKKIVVYTLKRGITDTVIYDEEAVVKRYSLKPKQLTDFRGLKGDPSDNIPGVPGIGEKTAIELLKKYNNIENLYKKIEEEKEKNKKQKNVMTKLLENKEKAFFSKQLAMMVKDLKIDVDLEKANWKRNSNLAELKNLFRELGFNSLISRIPNLDNTNQQSLLFKTRTESKKEIEINTLKEMEELKNRIKTKQKFAFNFNKNLYISADSEKIYNIKPDLIEELKPIIRDGKILKIGFEIKETIKSLSQKIKVEDWNNLFDVKIAAWLLNSDLKDPDFNKIYFAEFNESAENKNYLPAYILRVYKSLWEKLKNSKLIKISDEIEMPLIPVLAKMELVGVKIDKKAIKELNSFVKKEIKKLEEKIYKLSGIKFNINSPSQLGEVLFNRLQIKAKIKKTAGGAISTAAPELEKIRDVHPIIDLILRYRELQKLKTTYIDPFPELVNKKDGRLHTTFIQTGTVTGRLASQNPNLQNIPIKTELGQEFRKAFVAEKKYNLVSFDYSQMELRIVAHIAGDEKMIKAFKKGEDIHTRTASEVFEVSPEKVTKEMRRKAKVLNFGIIYGMGQLGFARSAGIKRTEAKEFIEKYFKEFSEVAEYMEKMRQEAREKGVVKTLFDRQRLLPEIFSSVPELARQAERMAINFPIQGTASDIMKIAMRQIYDFVNKNLKEEEAKTLLQVHDELLLEIKEDAVNNLAPKIKYIMENVCKLDVPLVVDVKIGKNWSKMKNLS